MKKRYLTLGIVLLTLVACNTVPSSSSYSSSSQSSYSSTSSSLSNSIISSTSSSVSSTSVVSSSLSSSSTSSNSTNSNSSTDSDIHVTSISITNKDQTNLKVGETLKLVISLLPENATNKIVNYESSDESVASVSFNGLITARKKGSCTISAISDDGGIKDTITIEVLDSTVTSFSAEFDSSVETISLKNNTFYKLVLGKNYPLNISFNSDSEQDNIIEASFSLDGYCEFNSNSNTLTPLKKCESLILTLNVRGTNLSKEFALKIINEGEKDSSEVIDKFEKSHNAESKLTISNYEVNLDFDTLDVYENRTHAVQSTNFTVYKSATDRYMIGDTQTKTTYKEYDSSVEDTSSLTSHIFKGMNNGDYYEYQVMDNGYHLVTPYKKSIVEEVSDSKTQITREDAITRSTKMIMNSHTGLSEIAKSHFTGLYENSIGFGSVPLYFGGAGVNNLHIVEKNNVIYADTTFIETKPSLSSNGEVYFNHGEYKFNNDGVLTEIKILSYVYDNTSYDFKNNVLKENPVYSEKYMTEYKQTFGQLNTQGEYALNPQNLYFTSYTPVLGTSDGYLASKYEIGKTYYISYQNQQPKYANSNIDSLIIDEVDNPNVAEITDSGRSIKIIGSGVCKLTIYSLKNSIERELLISVDVPSPSSIIAKIDGQEVKNSVEIKENESLNNITFDVLPAASYQEVDVSAEGVGNLTKNSNGSYSFVSQKAGTTVIKATSKLDSSISTTFVVNVKKGQTSLSFVEKLLSSSFSCLDENMVNTTDIVSNKLTFISENKVRLEIESREAQFTFITDYNVEINEENKTIIFKSFELTNGDYDEYNMYYLPTIKTGIKYKFNDECSSFEAKLYYLEYDIEYDINPDNSSLYTYYFEII